MLGKSIRDWINTFKIWFVKSDLQTKPAIERLKKANANHGAQAIRNILKYNDDNSRYQGALADQAEYTRFSETPARQAWKPTVQDFQITEAH